MRKIVFQMMTSLNGRLDDPIVWVKNVGDEQYKEIDRIYSSYDTVLVGRTTYEEMAAYWPGALSESVGTETNRAMAQRMHNYKKLVFSKSGDKKLSEWNNTELVIAGSDDELAIYLADLKKQPGHDIHLSGGASFAQSVIRLDLVDEFYFFVYPIVSQGKSWFAQLPENFDMKLLDSRTYENGVIMLHYMPVELEEKVTTPDSFSDLLTAR